MNYLIGLIFLILAREQGAESFLQVLLILLFFQLAWHMKKESDQLLLRFVAMGISLYHPQPQVFWFFILYVLADIFFHRQQPYLPFFGILGLLVYGFLLKLFSLEVLVLLLDLFLLVLFYSGSLFFWRKGAKSLGRNEDQIPL